MSTHQIVEHVNTNITGVFDSYALLYKIAMTDIALQEFLDDFTQVPVIPIFYQIPETQGVTRVVDTNFSTIDKGSIFLLERLEILKVQEFRYKLSGDPQIGDFVFAYAQLTAFGLEVFKQCVGLAGTKKRRPSKKKRDPNVRK